MMNVKHFFSIHHNDLGLFLVQCYTYYRQYKHKCVVKYLRILFLYSEHTNTRYNFILFFPQKQCTQCTSHSQPTQSCTYTTYKTTEEFTVYSYSKNKNYAASSLLLRSGHSTSSTSAAGEISPSMAIPAMKSISCYISTCVLHSLEKRYTRLWISVIHFPSPGRKKFLNRIEEWSLWREINN